MMYEMNVVCVSYHAPPHNSAESLCTIRMLTALAQYSVHVHLITADHYPSLDASIVEEIMDARIEVTRIRSPKPSKLNKLRAFSKYGTHSYRIEWAFEAISKTRKILSRFQKPPILITRSTPIVSNIVGYYCRDLACAWIPHLSDPFPPYEWREHWYSIFARPFNFRWARRFVEKSTFLTVTCRNAIRYMREKLRIDIRDNLYVLPHLAWPPLKTRNEATLGNSEFILGHFGNLMKRRNPNVLIEGVLIAAERYPNLRFLHYGHIDRQAFNLFPKDKIQRFIHFEQIRNLCPRKSTELRNQVQVNIVADTDFGLNYSPVILAKYPHAVCSGRPLLLLSHADSAAADYTHRFGGGLCVSYRDSYNVSEGISKLYQLWEKRERSCIPSLEYKKQFSPEVIVKPFLHRLADLYNNSRKISGVQI